MATVRLFFTFLVCGIGWFTMVSMVYFIYHDNEFSQAAAVESRRALFLQMESNVDIQPKVRHVHYIIQGVPKRRIPLL